MKKITDNKKRSVLQEGRNFGIGFSILKKDGNKYETTMPFTACKDYLNDYIYVETTKKKLGTAYGFKHNLINIFDNKRKFILGINTLNYTFQQWNQFEECKNILTSNYKNLEKFLNSFEEFIGLKLKTKITLDEDVLIISAPLYWSKNTGLISVYSLLIRSFFNVSKEELQKDLKTLLKEHKAFISADVYMKSSYIQFYDKLEKDKKIFDNFDYERYKITNTPSLVHNFGIQSMLLQLK